MNGALAFVDTSDCTVMNIAEHYMASDVEWDPTGRYVVTSVSWWSHKVRDLCNLTPVKQAVPSMASPPPLRVSMGQRALRLMPQFIDPSGPALAASVQLFLRSREAVFRED